MEKEKETQKLDKENTGSAPENSRLKKAAIILNILYFLSFIGFNCFMYRWISANDFLAVRFVGKKILFFAEFLLLLILICAVALKKGKKRYIASCIISVVMIIVMVAGSIVEAIYHKKIINVFEKADATLDRIIDNSKLSRTEYGIYILKESSAEKIEDLKDFVFGYSDAYAVEDMRKIENSVEEIYQKRIQTVRYKDPVQMIEKVYAQSERQAVILNQSMINMIEDAGDDDNNDEKSGKYAGFLEDFRCVYTISVENSIRTRSSQKDVTAENFTVYISGIDVEGDVKTKSRSDVNIIMSVNPVTHQILLVSTPRDYYVPLSISNGVCDKLTHAGNYGVDVSMETLEQLYDIKLDYFVRMNFTGFVDIIDALGGIDINSDYTFYTHGCQFYEGLNENVSGSRAIWFARERHSFAEGDRQRGKNQMKVIEAVIHKCMSKALLKKYDEIMDSVAESFQTNISKEDVQALVHYQIDESPKWKIQTYSVSGEGASRTTYSTPNSSAYVMIPDETTIETAKQYMKDMAENKTVRVPKE